MFVEKRIDEEVLSVLLKDKTTGKNIIWATNNYSDFWSSYAPDKEIKLEDIISYGRIVKPRTEKSKTEKKQRVRQKAEVFTPSWICNMQNNKFDEEWFGRKNVFNIEKENSWETAKEKVIFPDSENRTWQDYVLSERLEITCGEAPYITSRYDTVTGKFIEVSDRIGLLDRKLRVVAENTETREEWLKWAKKSVQNVYGYDWQGDNVLIARKNVLFTVAEHYEDKFGKSLEAEDLAEFAKVISWNIWQMDGLKSVVPNSCCTKEIIEQDLFESCVVAKPCEGCLKGDNKKHNGIYCCIMDWEKHKKVRFVDLF